MAQRKSYGDLPHKICRWGGLLHGVLTLILGIQHAAAQNAYIRFPSDNEKFTDDVNFERWRLRMFTLHPTTFVDLWTPIVFGLVAIFMHFRQFHLRTISDSYFRYMLFHFGMMMFGTIGYSGGFGILIGIYGILLSFFILCTFLVEDECRADMDLDYDIFRGCRGGGGGEVRTITNPPATATADPTP